MGAPPERAHGPLEETDQSRSRRLSRRTRGAARASQAPTCAAMVRGVREGCPRGRLLCRARRELSSVGSLMQDGCVVVVAEETDCGGAAISARRRRRLFRSRWARKLRTPPRGLRTKRASPPRGRLRRACRPSAACSAARGFSMVSQVFVPRGRGPSTFFTAGNKAPARSPCEPSGCISTGRAAFRWWQTARATGRYTCA